MSPFRVKDRLADRPDGGEKKPTIALHQCEVDTSRLPTLPEEETSDIKTPTQRDVANDKGDRAEVHVQNADFDLICICISKPAF